MTDMQHAMAMAAGADALRLEQAYWLAVAAGAANTRCGEAPELTHGALRLLTLSALRLPDLALQAYLLDVAECAEVDSLEFELHAAWEITRAAAATAEDAMRVPDAIAPALAHLLTLFMITSEAIAS